MYSLGSLEGVRTSSVRSDAVEYWKASRRKARPVPPVLWVSNEGDVREGKLICCSKHEDVLYRCRLVLSPVLCKYRVKARSLSRTIARQRFILEIQYRWIYRLYVVPYGLNGRGDVYPLSIPIFFFSLVTRLCLSIKLAADQQIPPRAASNLKAYCVTWI